MKKFKDSIQQVYEPKLNNQTIGHFRQLVNFIDTALADSYKKEGDDRAQSLVTYLLNIRDYLMREVTENNMRQTLLREAIEIIDELEREQTVPDDTGDDKKKEPDLRTQIEQEESSSVIDL